MQTRVYMLILFVITASLVETPFSPSLIIASETWYPRSTDTHSTDVAKSHVEEISQGTHKYTIFQGGTMDGRNCRSPMGCGIAREGAMIQTWESNRLVRIENMGDSDIVNPWLSNGRNNFRSVEEIVSSAVSPGMTDADKAFALWFQEIQYRHHSGGDNNELGDPVKVFNIYGYNTCGNDSICLATLWRNAGLKVAPARVLGHCVSQAFYEGGWHFYDGDMHCVYLLRDNQTVAGEQDIVRDHDLIKRTHSKGILFPDTWWSDPEMCSMYFYEGPVQGQRSGKTDTTMNMILRPGEALTWRWGQLSPLKYHGALHTNPTYEEVIYNGLWEYYPDFSKAIWRKGAMVVENITEGSDGLAADEGKTGTIIWSMHSPYIFVGGRLKVDGVGARFFICQDGKTWKPAQENLDKLFPIVGPACYEYQLKCQLEGSSQLRRLAIINDVQMAPLAMPEMVVGDNVFTYSDQSVSDRKVRITHNWVERSASRPPLAPAGAVYPLEGGQTNGTDIVFQWTDSSDPDGDTITDYQFELSARADMKWPLSMSFYKLISKTADAVKEKNKTTDKVRITVKAQYTLPQAGLLTPDRTYYWHVRAQDDKGVWGPWSETWSFTPQGPSYPLDVTVEYDQTKCIGILRWKANPVGRTPVKYRVYGSDEKGFTIGDQRYQSVVGVTKEEMAEWNPWFPANFITETTATELAVLGGDIDLASANKTYYRVVAIDEHGNRSGPSDYSVAPRPIIYSKPVVTTQIGTQYRYQIRVNRSLGDLSSRMVDGQQISGYFDIEKPRFTLSQGPEWLKIDETAGLLSGIPDVPGRADVVVTVNIDRQVRKLDEAILRWGNEKVLSTETEHIGTATQKFVIDVVKAAAYIVDQAAPGAADTNTGTEQMPFKTVQHAADVAGPGDIVYVMEGRYDERIKVKAGGTEGKPVAFVAMPRRSVIVGGFDLEASYIRVEGFEITADEPTTAVQLHGSHCEIIDNYIHDMMVGVNGTVGKLSTDGKTRDYSAVTHNRIAYNKVYHCEYGFILGGENWLVENNEISRLFMYAQGKKFDDCDYTRFFGKGCIQRYNYYHGTDTRESRVAHVDCIQTFTNNGEIAQDLLFEFNTCFDWGQGCMVESAPHLGSVRNWTFRHNIFSSKLPSYKGAWGLNLIQTPDVTIENNTFVGITWFGVGLRGAESTNGQIRNNIFCDVRTAVEDRMDFTPANPVTEHNLTYNTSVLVGETNINGKNPLFTDPENRNFRLKMGSPAIGACKDGDTIGAMEYPNVYYVDPRHPAASDEPACGYPAVPLASLSKACEIAQQGETIVLRGGIYREVMAPEHDGVTILAFKGEKVTISGAYLIKGWKRELDGSWSAPLADEPKKLLRDGRPWSQFSYDKAAGQIIVKSGGDPRLHVFETVLRDKGFNLRGKKNIRTKGITVVNTLEKPTAVEL